LENREIIYALKKRDDGLVYVVPLPPHHIAYIVRDMGDWLAASWRNLFRPRDSLTVDFRTGVVRYH
jgi:hypothetical protein